MCNDVRFAYISVIWHHANKHLNTVANISKNIGGTVITCTLWIVSAMYNTFGLISLILGNNP
jgi:hypothetical protein